jgi:hypothetical protein
MYVYNMNIKLYLKQAHMLKCQLRSGFLASIRSGADLSECLRVCVWHPWVWDIDLIPNP